MAARKKKRNPDEWSVKGELALNCSCDVFCPCVVSLGQHPPTEGHCHAWMAVRIDEGYRGDINLSGLNIALMLDIPGKMGEGKWIAAGYFDERADDDQYNSLEQIFTGSLGGTTGVLRLLVSDYLGGRREEVTYETDGKTRIVGAGRAIKGMIAPIPGGSPDEDVVVRNTQYWMGADVTIARGLKSRVRDFGRVWDFENRSAELLDIHWSGSPK